MLLSGFSSIFLGSGLDRLVLGFGVSSALRGSFVEGWLSSCISLDRGNDGGDGLSVFVSGSNRCGSVFCVSNFCDSGPWDSDFWGRGSEEVACSLVADAFGSEPPCFLPLSAAAPLTSSLTRSCPTVTVSSSLARNSLIVPASGALTATSI